MYPLLNVSSTDALASRTSPIARTPAVKRDATHVRRFSVVPYKTSADRSDSYISGCPYRGWAGMLTTRHVVSQHL